MPAFPGEIESVAPIWNIKRTTQTHNLPLNGARSLDRFSSQAKGPESLPAFLIVVCRGTSATTASLVIRSRCVLDRHAKDLGRVDDALGYQVDIFPVCESKVT